MRNEKGKVAPELRSGLCGCASVWGGACEVLFAVVPGREAHLFSEVAGESAVIAEAGAERDFGDRPPRFEQLVAGEQDPEAHDVVLGGRAKGGEKIALKLAHG